MKSQVYDQFGSGLLVLIMLTIAVVASQAQPGYQEPAPALNAFELGADFRITIDRQQLEKIENIGSVIESMLDLPIEASLTLEDSAAPVAESDDSSKGTAH